MLWVRTRQANERSVGNIQMERTFLAATDDRCLPGVGHYIPSVNHGSLKRTRDKGDTGKKGSNPFQVTQRPNFHGGAYGIRSERSSFP